MPMQFDVVVAMELERGIGKNGALPWRLPGDMKYFKELTSKTSHPDKKNAVIMGRKTWESIPAKFRPLPDRINFILTRNENYGPIPFAFTLRSLSEALMYCTVLGYVDRVFVIGGGEIYQEALQMPECRNIYVTQVWSNILCDVKFPDIKGFNLFDESEFHNEADHSYTFQTWVRTP